MRLLSTAALALLPVLPLCAQNGSARSRAAALGLETITEGDIRRRIEIIAHDSMGGRNTPSRGLDMTARYIATEFRRFGLKPAGDSGSFLQRYPLGRPVLDAAASTITFAAGRTSAVASFARDAFLLRGGSRDAAAATPALVLGGALTAEAIAPLVVRGKTIVLVSDPANPRSAQRVLSPLYQKQPARLVLLTGRDSAAFAGSVRRQIEGSAGVERSTGQTTLVVEVREQAIAAVLASADIDLGRIRSSAVPVVREVPGLTVSSGIVDQPGAGITAPNVVGVLEGSDPSLRNEYIVFSAHMDHVGTGTPVNGDSIYNGADDDASGTVAVIELAEAFSRPGARPKRSLIFLTVSGEEHGLWGSEWFAEHSPVPTSQIVANLNMDMIGRNWKDTIAVIGKEHSDLGETLERVARAHPELRMNPIDDIWPRENFYFRSDHYNFARQGVPILFFFNGTHPDYHAPGDEPSKIDAEKESRIVRLVYHVGQEVGNAPERPKWNEESYRRIVKP